MDDTSAGTLTPSPDNGRHGSTPAPAGDGRDGDRVRRPHVAAAWSVWGHLPTLRPYPGAPGFAIATCRVCAPHEGRVVVDGDDPAVWACAVWREAIADGLVVMPS